MHICSRVTSRTTSRVWCGTFRVQSSLRADLAVWLSHMSSIWPWSGVPKVRLYSTFINGIRHSPPRMKNQRGSMRKNTLYVKKWSLVWVLVMCHVWLVWFTNNLKHKSLMRVEKSHANLDLISYFYSLSRFSVNGFTLRMFILSTFVPRWTMIVPFVWTVVMSQGFLCHLDSALRRIPSFRNSTFWPTL